jgi:hypothetical protein
MLSSETCHIRGYPNQFVIIREIRTNKNTHDHSIFFKLNNTNPFSLSPPLFVHNNDPLGVIPSCTCLSLQQLIPNSKITLQPISLVLQLNFSYLNFGHLAKYSRNLSVTNSVQMCIRSIAFSHLFRHQFTNNLIVFIGPFHLITLAVSLTNKKNEAFIVYLVAIVNTKVELSL